MRQDLEVGTFVMTRFIVYELADGETVVAATEGLSPLLTDSACRSEHPGLATLADRERERAAHVLVRLEHREATTPVSSAA